MSRLYTTTRWRRGRLSFLARNPLCSMCARAADFVLRVLLTTSNPIKGDQLLFFDQANWQALCFNCHNSHKQSVERVGFDQLPGVDGLPTDPRHPFFTEARGGG